MLQRALAETVWSAVTSMTRFPQKTNPLVTGLVIGLGFAVCGAQAAPPAVDGTASTGSTTGSSMTISHTTSSGTDRLMLVGVSVNHDGTERVSSITYNGLPLTLVGFDETVNDGLAEIWKLVNPDAGTHDVVITFNKNLARTGVGGVITFTGVDQAYPVGPFTSDKATSGTNATVDVPSATDELVFGVACAEASSLTVGAGQTPAHWNGTWGGGSNTAASGTTEAGATTVTTSWTRSGSGQWVVAGVSIKPAGENRIAFSTNRDSNYEVYRMDADGSNPVNLSNAATIEVVPSWSPDNSRIAFETTRDGNREIYVMDADGTNQTNLTNNAASDNQPRWSPDGDKIVFWSNRDGNTEIYAMNADGTTQTNLTNHAAVDVLADWSPDGTKIAFQSNRDGVWEIYVMDANGSNPTRITNNAGDDYEPAWSPDGAQIAFHSNRDGNLNVYVMDANGSNQTRLTTHAAEDKEPVWSADGAQIAFSTKRDGNWEVYTMNADGSMQTNRTINAAIDEEPSWQRTPAQIAFTSWRDGSAEIYVMATDGSNPTRLTTNAAIDEKPDWAPGAAEIAFETYRDGNGQIYKMDADGSNPVNLSSNAFGDGAPTWSPDGNRIAFRSYRDSDWEIYSMNADGSSQTNLTSDPTEDDEPDWSPDGTKIVFASKRDGNFEIHVMGTDGSNPTNLTNHSAEEQSPAWSPDGTKIVFASKRDGNFEIYVMNADGSNQTNLTNHASEDYDPHWSAGGSKIVFHTSRDGDSEVYVMDADGLNQTNLTNIAGGDSFPVWSSSVVLGPTLMLADHAAGQESDAFTESGSETNAELFAFKLDPGPDTISVMLMIFRISDIAGLTDSDWAGSNLEIIQDDVVIDGNIGAGEETSVGGLWVVDQAAGKITFSPSFSVSAATNYILRGTFSSLSEGDKVTIVLNPSDITASETVSGSTTAVTHKEGCFYVERFQQWSAADPDTWEVKDLSGAPFNVPANAVVEVAVRNSRANFERYGGVRAVGSGLDRRLLLQEAEMGGMSVLVMHVQADASSQIRHYSDATADVDFVLLGYWDCGTYVEAFQPFTAGASLAWQDHDLWTYGVGSSQVAEMVMTNSDPFSEWEAGVRKKGPNRQRVLDIQEAEAGGVDTATMFVTADATANATIQVYAQDDFSITFYLVGYFTTAPRTYNELFSSIGSPATSAFWQDIALSSFGVPAQAVAEISLANMTLAAEHNMGVRENGSTRARLLALQEAEAGGGDYGRMQVTADATSTIEFYQELISDPHNFFLTGYWSATGPVTPKIIRWSEVDPYQP